MAKVYEIETAPESGEFELRVVEDGDIVDTFWDEGVYFVPADIVKEYNIQPFTKLDDLGDDAREAVQDGKECVETYFREWVKTCEIDEGGGLSLCR
jgi:hypothetical protein